MEVQINIYEYTVKSNFIYGAYISLPIHLSKLAIFGNILELYQYCLQLYSNTNQGNIGPSVRKVPQLE